MRIDLEGIQLNEKSREVKFGLTCLLPPVGEEDACAVSTTR